jgi:hypothetical protein
MKDAVPRPAVIDAQATTNRSRLCLDRRLHALVHKNLSTDIAMLLFGYLVLEEMSNGQMDIVDI